MSVVKVDSSVNLIIESQILRRKEAALFYLNPIECGLGLRLGAKQYFLKHPGSQSKL